MPSGIRPFLPVFLPYPGIQLSAQFGKQLHELVNRGLNRWLGEDGRHTKTASPRSRFWAIRQPRTPGPLHRANQDRDFSVYGGCPVVLRWTVFDN